MDQSLQGSLNRGIKLFLILYIQHTLLIWKCYSDLVWGIWAFIAESSGKIEEKPWKSSVATGHLSCLVVYGSPTQPDDLY